MIRPASTASAGTSTRNVSSSTPNATRKAICARKSTGITDSAANVAASTTPAEVITPPVTLSAVSVPPDVPSRVASSSALVIRKML
jgi:hypothetical protein